MEVIIKRLEKLRDDHLKCKKDDDDYMECVEYWDEVINDVKIQSSNLHHYDANYQP